MFQFQFFVDVIIEHHQYVGETFQISYDAFRVPSPPVDDVLSLGLWYWTGFYQRLQLRDELPVDWVFGVSSAATTTATEFRALRYVVLNFHAVILQFVPQVLCAEQIGTEAQATQNRQDHDCAYGSIRHSLS